MHLHLEGLHADYHHLLSDWLHELLQEALSCKRKDGDGHNGMVITNCEASVRQTTLSGTC